MRISLVNLNINNPSNFAGSPAAKLISTGLPYSTSFF